jgi:hypothetical protein
MMDRLVLKDGLDIIKNERHSEAVVVGNERRKDDGPASRDDQPGR